ncbi:MAG: Gfo/Idh/MocA family oxidoreductase [Candidatus Thalassarchaeaceae archaeon]|jgi:predicted dehydrogenase|nr:Gfo/Idh/MocA family oxidoreductase [Candidatus Thalassarchaeaceae archaeon]
MGITIGVIGCGHWGKNHAKTLTILREEKAIDNFVICDINSARAKKVADYYNVGWCTNPLDLVNIYNVDAVTIATPTTTHTELSITFLNAGIDVLVEKPMALDVDDAERMIKCSKLNNRILAVGHPLRYHKPLREAISLARNGHLGSLQSIECERLSVREPRTDTGVIASLAIHDLDICLMLFGERNPLRINSLSLPSNIEGIEDYAVIQLEFPSGENDPNSTINANLTSSWRSRLKGKVRSTRIHGQDASIDIDTSRHDGFFIHHHPSTLVEGKTPFLKSPGQWIPVKDGEPSLTSELRAFANACISRTTEQLFATAEICLPATKLVALAKQASKQSTPLELDQDFSQYSIATPVSPKTW